MRDTSQQTYCRKCAKAWKPVVVFSIGATIGAVVMRVVWNAIWLYSMVMVPFNAYKKKEDRRWWI